MESPWFSLPTVKPEPSLRLFCFGYAGSGASVYFPWIKEFQWSRVEIRPIQLPGRENRLNEAPCNTIAEIIGRLLPEIAPFLNCPFVLFGHSLGSIIAFELARGLRKAGLRQPSTLIVSSGQPPHLPRLELPLHALEHDAFIAAVSERYRGIPPELLQIPELLEIFLPILRADLKLLETYTYTPESALAVNLVALGGDSDDLLEPSVLERWKDQGMGRFSTALFPGGHFYLRESRSQLIEYLKKILSA
jgi:medium-chain acyl-[acyl-carrier-protein] hydrolase